MIISFWFFLSYLITTVLTVLSAIPSNHPILLQDDFLDLAEDEHHVDMAMCLANGQPQTASFTNQAPSSGSCSGDSGGGSPGLVMKAETNGLVHGLGHTTASNHTTNNHVNQHHLVDNPVMKLDNLDNWDQDV